MIESGRKPTRVLQQMEGTGVPAKRKQGRGPGKKSLASCRTWRTKFEAMGRTPSLPCASRVPLSGKERPNVSHKLSNPMSAQPPPRKRCVTEITTSLERISVVNMICTHCREGKATASELRCSQPEPCHDVADLRDVA